MNDELTQDDKDRIVRALKYYAYRIESLEEANAADDLANKMRSVPREETLGSNGR